MIDSSRVSVTGMAGDSRVVGMGELPPAAGTLQFPIAALSSHPQIQALLLLVDFLPVHTVSGPLKDARKLVVTRQLPSLKPFLGVPVISPVLRILAQRPI